MTCFMQVSLPERCGTALCRTVSDLQLADNMLGLVVAGMSVVSSSMQQIFCRTMQQKHKLSSHELLSNTAPVQVRSIGLHPHRCLVRASSLTCYCGAGSAECERLRDISG